MKKFPIVPFVLFAMLVLLHFLSAVLGFWKSPGFIQFELKCAIGISALLLISFWAEKRERRLPKN